MYTNKDSKNIYVVFSGSGVKFPYFIGVLRYLIDNDYNIKGIAGTAGGSLVAGLYTSNILSSQDLMIFARDFRFTDIMTLNWKSFFKLGLYKWNESKFINILHEYGINSLNIVNDQPIKLKIVSSNITKNNYEYLENISLYKAILASMSVPYIFTPFNINNNYYVDGGLTINFDTNIWDKENENSYPVLGFYFKDNKIINNKPKNLLEYSDMLLNTAINSQEKIQMNLEKYIKKNYFNIPIYTNFPSFKFKVTNEDVKKMVDQGYNQSKIFLEEVFSERLSNHFLKQIYTIHADINRK
jgi:predicted acylesterase/phospholipase RssA